MQKSKKCEYERKKKTCGIEKKGFYPSALPSTLSIPLPDVDILQGKRRLKRLKRRKFIRKIYCAITKRKQGKKGEKKANTGRKKSDNVNITL